MTPPAAGYRYEQLGIAAVSVALVAPVAAQLLEIMYRSTRRFKLRAFERLSVRASAARARRSVSSRSTLSAAPNRALPGEEAFTLPSFLPATVPRVSRSVARVCACVVALLLARSVDPAGAGGAYGQDGVDALENAAGALVLAAALAVGGYTIGVGSKLSQTPRPAYVGVANALLTALLAVSAIGTVVARRWTTDPFWAGAANSWAAAAALAHVAGEALVGTRLMEGAGEQFANQASELAVERLPYLVSALRRLRAARFVAVASAVVAVPALAVHGWRAWDAAPGASVRDGWGPYAAYSGRRAALAWPTAAAVALLLWYVWLPLSSDSSGDFYHGPREVSSQADELSVLSRRGGLPPLDEPYSAAPHSEMDAPWDDESEYSAI